MCIVGPLRMVTTPDRGVRGCLAMALCAGIAAGTRFYHTQNSNHFNQNTGLIFFNKHQLSLLVNDNTAEFNVFQVKKPGTEISRPDHAKGIKNYLG